MAPSIEQYLRIRSAAAAGALPTGELGYLSDATGHMQLYQISSDGLHDQLTFGDERITAAVPSPTEGRWLIARDAGGNELHALFALDPDGGEIALTGDPAAMHVPGAFSPDGRRHAFAHTGRNGTDFDIGLVGLDGEGRRELAQPGGYCAVLDWSEAGILVARYARPFDHDLYLCDPESGALEHLTPHEGEAIFAPAVLLADGAVLCTTDAGCEHARAALLRRGAAPEFLTSDDAEVDAVATDAARARRAWVVNRDGYAELVVEGETVRELAAGVLGRPHFLAEGGIALTVAPPDDTADAWTLPGPVRRTRAAVGGLRRGDFARPALRTFETFDGRRIPYFLYGETGAPTLCHVHGGPESQFRPQLLPVLQYLAARGIAVAAPNVRGSTGYGRTFTHLDDVEKRLDSVSDLAGLARALGAGAGTPVAVMGGSYGGYMTMAAITEHPDLWAAAVNTVGIVNFVTFLERTSAYRRAIREAEYGSLEHDRELLERISPLRKVAEIRTPLMVIHGANDPRVPVSEAEQVVEALRERGGEVEYLRYEDEGHGIQRLPNRLDCYPRVAAFLERHLGLA